MTYRELKKSHIHLIKGKKGMQEKLLGLDEKCQNMMLLKFGREVSEIFLNHRQLQDWVLIMFLYLTYLILS